MGPTFTCSHSLVREPSEFKGDIKLASLQQLLLESPGFTAVGPRGMKQESKRLFKEDEYD